MTGTQFPQQQFIMGKPVDWKDEDCYGLPVAKRFFENSEGQQVPMLTSCWKLNENELKIIQETGIIWLNIVGSGMPPVSMQVENPF